MSVIRSPKISERQPCLHECWYKWEEWRTLVTSLAALPIICSLFYGCSHLPDITAAHRVPFSAPAINSVDRSKAAANTSLNLQVFPSLSCRSHISIDNPPEQPEAILV